MHGVHLNKSSHIPSAGSTSKMEEQVRIRCAVVRGGTSRAVFIMRNELPSDPVVRDRVILAIFGSPDARQIDGLGGADPLTSKLAIIGPASRPDADVDYTFGQVDIHSPSIGYSSNCGNISSGVGPFAIDEGLVDAKEPLTEVRIHNTNTNKIIVAEVPVVGNKAAVEGDYKIDGVPGTGAKIMMDWTGTAGASTGRLLPTGNARDTIDLEGKKIEVSVVDVGDSVLFVRAPDVGLKGTETPKEFDSNTAAIQRLEAIRKKARELSPLLQQARRTPGIACVNGPTSYVNHVTMEVVNADEVDFVSRYLFMGILHKAYPGSGTVCTGVAARIPGTIVNEVIPKKAREKEVIRIGHPAGVCTVESIVQPKGQEFLVKRVAIGRTARRIMDGYVCVPRKVFVA